MKPNLSPETETLPPAIRRVERAPPLRPVRAELHLDGPLGHGRRRWKRYVPPTSPGLFADPCDVGASVSAQRGTIDHVARTFPAPHIVLAHSVHETSKSPSHPLDSKRPEGARRRVTGDALCCGYAPEGRVRVGRHGYLSRYVFRCALRLCCRLTARWGLVLAVGVDAGCAYE